MTAHFKQFLCLSDNYGVLVHDSETKATAAIDAPDGEAVVKAADEQGWAITDILITHHHADHIQGIPAVKARFPQAKVTAPAKEADKIGGVDRGVAEGDLVKVGALAAKIIETPGHTAGHICYWFESESVLFAADTLFALGCGRVFETPLDVMWHSLSKLTRLPLETQVYAGHEYTQSNAKFALGVEPDNAVLKERAAQIDTLRAAGKATLPTTIEIELATNPFLRVDSPSIRATLGMQDATPAAVFTELRERKNRG